MEVTTHSSRSGVTYVGTHLHELESFSPAFDDTVQGKRYWLQSQISKQARETLREHHLVMMRQIGLTALHLACQSLQSLKTTSSLKRELTAHTKGESVDGRLTLHR